MCMPASSTFFDWGCSFVPGTCTISKTSNTHTSRLEFSALFDLFRMSYSQIFIFPTNQDKCRNYIYLYSISISSVRTRNELSQESSAWCILLEYVQTHRRISSFDQKLRIPLQCIISSGTAICCSVASHTSGFHPQTQKLELLRKRRSTGFNKLQFARQGYKPRMVRLPIFERLRWYRVSWHISCSLGVQIVGRGRKHEEGKTIGYTDK